MAELVESVKQHGIITPLTLAAAGDGRFTIIAGERRYRAAKQANLKEVPAQVRDGDGEALAPAVAENVIRADLNPVEEARAYERLVAEHGETAEARRAQREAHRRAPRPPPLARRGVGAAGRAQSARLRARADPGGGARGAAR
jgi:ParB family chromosome partitioning protein